MDQAKAEPERGLQAGDAERRLVKFLLLVHERVRCVVGGDGVYRSVGQALDYGCHVFSRALRLLTDLGLIQSTFPVVKITDVPKLQRYAKG